MKIFELTVRKRESQGASDPDNRTGAGKSAEENERSGWTVREFAGPFFSLAQAFTPQTIAPSLTWSSSHSRYTQRVGYFDFACCKVT